MKALSTARELVKLDCDEWRDLLQGMMDGEADIQSDSYRAIHKDSIDEIMEEELLSDRYVLGCFNDWFIADITGLSLDAVQKAQKSDSYELLGELMVTHIEEVVSSYVSMDGYGHHFSSYDGSEEEVGDYYIFRTN